MKRLVGHNQSIQAMARDSFVGYEGWTGHSPMTTVIDTPNGFIASDNIMHYYVKDYQGNVRQVVNADGVVEQDNHYYPYGMLMGESSNILASAHGYKSVSFNPYLFGTKEYLTTASANLLDFAARTYDPTTLLFQTQDPLSDKFRSYNGYLYCGCNPINKVDPTGCSTEVILQDDGRYKIYGGNLEDEDLNIYVVAEKDGKYERTGEIIGVTPTITSFYDSDKGEWATNSYIDTKDRSGIKFISNMTGENIPVLANYMWNAGNGGKYDFKATNGTLSLTTKKLNPYRGMPIETSDTGTRMYASARDIGNIVAGYVAYANGLSWNVARLGFDGYQSIKSGRLTTEGASTQNAEFYGYNKARTDISTMKRLLNFSINLNTTNAAIKSIIREYKISNKNLYRKK